MKQGFALSQHGRDPLPLDGTFRECMSQVRDIAKGELKRARAVSKEATLHHPTEWAWLITMGKDRNSSLWTSVSLIKY